MGTTTDVATLAGRVAKDEGVWGNVSRYDGARAHEGKFPNGYATKNDRARAYRGAVLYEGGCNFPVIGAFQLTLGSDGAGKEVVGEADVGPDEYAVFDGDAFKDRGVVLNFD